MNTQIEIPENRLHLPNVDAVRATPPVQPETVLEPQKSWWHPINIRELWHFRDLLYFLVWRDVKLRYKQTVLGVAWSVLQPAMMMVVFTIFFSNLAKLPSGTLPSGEPLWYPVFVLAGLLPWTFFTTGLANAGNSVIGSERLITKVYFPRLAIPFAAVGAAIVDFLIALSLLGVLMLCCLIPPAPSIFLLPFIFLLIVLAATGFGTLLAALNVAYRDFRYLMTFFLQLWVFATPTVYMEMPATTENTWVQWLIHLNPLTALIGAFRAALFGMPIDWWQLGIAGVSVAVIFLVGCFYFRKVEDGFADII